MKCKSGKNLMKTIQSVGGKPEEGPPNSVKRRMKTSPPRNFVIPHQHSNHLPAATKGFQISLDHPPIQGHLQTLTNQ
jgi:hypothetical protein